MGINSHSPLARLAIASLCTLGLALGTGSALAEPPDGVGGGNPGTGGGGKPENPGGGGGKPEKPGRGKGGLYADLVVVKRDIYGAPDYLTVETEHGPVDCLQPITSATIDGVSPVTNDADGTTVYPIPLGTGIEGEECDVNPAYAAYVQEVLFGRLNLGRSPEKVLDQQLRDIMGSLSSSSDLKIDEAGRLVYFLGDIGFEVDSPGHNLAIYRELLETGQLDDLTLPEPGNCDDPSPGGCLDHAAAALGAAAGKGDLINLDLVVYNNRILGIPDGTDLNTVTRAGEKYMDYTGYGYTRSSVYPGCVRGQLVNFPDVGYSRYFSGRIMDCVFGTITEVDELSASCSAGQDFTGATGVHNFAQRADDARAVIAFVHDNVVNDSTALLTPALAGIDQVGQNALQELNEGSCPPPTNLPAPTASSSMQDLGGMKKGQGQ